MDANGILQLDGTQFAERGIAGNRADIREGIDEYSKLNFDKIYPVITIFKGSAVQV